MIIQQQADFSFYTSSFISMYISQKLIWIVKIVSAQTRFPLSGNSHSNILNCTHKGLDKIIDDLPLNVFS